VVSLTQSIVNESLKRDDATEALAYYAASERALTRSPQLLQIVDRGWVSDIL